MDERTMREQNRRSWNAATRVHNAHKRDQAAWLADGHSTLYPEELALLGDVTGRRIAHLMCNAGQDTLSLARRGAHLVGVDISDEAIGFATQLSADAGIPARFDRADVDDWLQATEDRFDDVFTSYGGIGWLPDLAAFLRGVARVLKPGGRFVLQDFHPLCWSHDAQGASVEAYFLDEPLVDQTGVGDYVGDAGDALAPMGFIPAAKWSNPEPSVSFQWTLGTLLQGIADAGLRLEVFREQPWSNGCRLHEGMVADEHGRWRRPPGVVALPLMVGVVARRPG